MKRWQGSCIGAVLVLLIGGGSLLFFVPVGGAMLVGIPPVFDRLTGWVVCPGAVSISQEEYNSGPVTSSPSGMTGHQEEWTCTFEDGSQKVVPNEEIALKGLGASFTVAGICGGLVVLLLMIIAAIIGSRLAKPKTIS
ncbi:MAG TPA: hypothetical protein VFC02_19015 [Anaerolineales bacterium]|jgi:hypothetical protein|nr:hypothetical protein [Anaerolineales bacterium]